MDGVSKKALELEDYGVSTITKRVDFEVEDQLVAMDELLQEEIHGLLIAPYNDEKIRAKIDEFMERQIPVVTVNTDIEGSKRIAYVGSDYFQSGRVAAGMFGLLMQNSAELAIITGSSNVLCHSERIRGFKEVLEADYPDIHIAEIRENHDDEFESYAITKQILENYPKMDALFFTAAGVWGGCKAVIESRRKVKVVTFDEVPTTLDMLKEGIISVTIGQQPFRQGFKALDVLFEHLTSGTIPDASSCIIELTMKIKENIT
jgi:LacI family transcriptional regulator